jgi:23S rRNA pseudouridine1911/1915/1917 synthase
MRTLTFTIPSEYQDRKVLHYLRGCAGLSSRVIRNLKTYDDGILLNGEPVRTIDRLSVGDVLTVNLPDDPVEQLPPMPDP